MRDRTVKSIALAVASFALLTSGQPKVALAQTSTASAPPAIDMDAGRTVALSCVPCHGPRGISSKSGVPHLAGQHGAYLARALTAYRDGQRAGPAMTAMVTVAATLSRQDIVNVAAYFANLQPFTSTAVTDKTSPAVRENHFAAAGTHTQACAGCHGDDGNVDRPGTPSLAGQNADYLASALAAYRRGSRPDAATHASLRSLDDAEIEGIAAYYAAAAPRRSQAPVAGDADAGRALAAACAVCHGEDGNSLDVEMPRLAGLDAQYLAATIRAYNSGRRDHSAMRDLAAALTEDEVINLAAFYARQQPRPAPERLTTAEWARRCDRCHGPGGHSTDARFPILAGQSEAYLAGALRLYHGAKRASDMMYAISFQMSRDDIKRLAAYYAGKTAD